MIAGIHHATFLTSDLARARAFYEGVLGLRPSPDRLQMTFEGIWYDVAPHQQIHLMQLPDPETGLQRPAHPQGVRRGCMGLKPQQHTQHGGRDRHLALAVKDLSLLRARLDAAGIACTQSQSGRRALFCRDPDQNALEFIEVAE
jgi:catechol 2,3-dioxygenase-like lactoylglutathione lyase family enzyme